MYAWHSVSVACRPAETRRRRGEIGSIRRSILVGHRRPNRRQRVNAKDAMRILLGVVRLLKEHKIETSDTSAHQITS